MSGVVCPLGPCFSVGNYITLCLTGMVLRRQRVYLQTAGIYHVLTQVQLLIVAIKTFTWSFSSLSSCLAAGFCFSMTSCMTPQQQQADAAEEGAALSHHIKTADR